MMKLTLILTLVCCSLLAVANLGHADEQRSPNVILIMADDLGIEGVGCYGGVSYETPNIDELAATGIRFENAHAQPLCTNTRLQLMTGLHNNRNWICFGILDPKAKTIGHYLHDAGYKTCIAGKWQLQSYDPPGFPGADQRRGIGMHPKDAGFDSYSLFHALHTEDKGSRYADPTWLEDGTLKTDPGGYGPDHSVNYINEFMEREKDQPFFVYYPMALPHWPMTPSPSSSDWANEDMRFNEDPRHFKSMVQYMDKSVGKIVEQVDRLGLRENTLIIFYSDNGTHLTITSKTKNGAVAGGKGLPTDAGTHVPLVVNWPGVIDAGVSDVLVDSTDFIPTVMEAVQRPLKGDEGLDGMSFYKALTDKNAEISEARQWIYSYYDPRPGHDKDQFVRHVSARDSRWKLYENGQLFDIDADVLEQQPILQTSDTAETSAVRARLALVLEKNAVTE